MQQIPTHTLVGNLRFTTSGTVWADYLVTGVSYGMRPEKEKAVVRALHQALFRAVSGESLYFEHSAPIASNNKL